MPCSDRGLSAVQGNFDWVRRWIADLFPPVHAPACPVSIVSCHPLPNKRDWIIPKKLNYGFCRTAKVTIQEILLKEGLSVQWRFLCPTVQVIPVSVQCTQMTWIMCLSKVHSPLISAFLLTLYVSFVSIKQVWNGKKSKIIHYRAPTLLIHNGLTMKTETSILLLSNYKA